MNTSNYFQKSIRHAAKKVMEKYLDMGDEHLLLTFKSDEENYGLPVLNYKLVKEIPELTDYETCCFRLTCNGKPIYRTQKALMTKILDQYNDPERNAKLIISTLEVIPASDDAMSFRELCQWYIDYVSNSDEIESIEDEVICSNHADRAFFWFDEEAPCVELDGKFYKVDPSEDCFDNDYPFEHLSINLWNLLINEIKFELENSCEFEDKGLTVSDDGKEILISKLKDVENIDVTKSLNKILAYFNKVGMSK